MDLQSCLISLWLELELCAMAVLLTNGEITCYCDAPRCAATGYMCKSELDACFTKVLDPLIQNSPITHGCLHPIGSVADICSSSLKPANALTRTSAPMLDCCHDDLCNHRGLHDLAHSTGDDVPLRDIRYSPENNKRNLVARVQELASAKEVWFRASVIAVPIVGGLILVLLIMVALRMLRSENKRLQDQRQQMLSRLHYSLHGLHNKKGHVDKLDMECMVPVTGLENCCLTCDKMRQAELGNDKILSLVHWGMYSGHGKLEFI